MDGPVSGVARTGSTQQPPDPYDTPKARAHAFFAAGLTGIWAMLRHSSATCRGLPIFGPPGLNVIDPPSITDLEALTPPD